MTDQKEQIAIFAAGCFWGIQQRFHFTPGVTATSVGYIGGHTANPSYREVCSDNTGHAEAVKVVFDPDKISYSELLEVFWDCHDPTTLNRQGPDIGSQYRSAIYYTSDEQRSAAEESKKQQDESGRFSSPIVTEITKAPTYFLAEDYHQFYVLKRRGEWSDQRLAG